MKTIMTSKGILYLSARRLLRGYSWTSLHVILVAVLLISFSTIIPLSQAFTAVAASYASRTVTVIEVRPRKFLIHNLWADSIINPELLPIEKEYFFTEANVSDIQGLEQVESVVRGLEFNVKWNPGTEKWLQRQEKTAMEEYRYLTTSDDPAAKEVLELIEQRAAELNITVLELLMMKAHQGSWAINILGVETNKTVGMVSYFNNVVEGRFLKPTEENGIVITTDVVEYTGLKVGDEVTFQIGKGNYTYQIVGVIGPHFTLHMVADLSHLESIIKHELGNNSSILPLYTVLFVKAASPVYVTDIAERIQSLYPNAWVEYAGFTATLARQLLESLKANYNLTSALVILLTGTLLLISRGLEAIKRRREVGLLKAMGWGRMNILNYTIIQSAIIGLVAGILATLSLLLMGPYLRDIFIPNLSGYSGLAKEEALSLVSFIVSKVPDRNLLMLAPVIGIIISVTASIIASAYYLRLSPAEALREV